MKRPERTLQEYNHLHGRYARRGLWLISVVAMASLAGCGPQTNVQLLQPALQGAQRQLYLSSEQAYWAEGKTAGRLLVEFPLPGASKGNATYLLYLRLPPAMISNEAKTADGSVQKIVPCGFFIQTRGEYAGLAGVSGGTMRVLRRDHDACKIALDLTCDDGSRIEGEALAKRNEANVKSFEMENRAADVEKLIARCATQSAPSG